MDQGFDLFDMRVLAGGIVVRRSELDKLTKLDYRPINTRILMPGDGSGDIFR